MSDQITVGNIHNSIAAAIGDGATAVANITTVLPPEQRPKTAYNLTPFNRHFTGRLETIQAIAAGFVSGRESMVVTQAISGLGGVGKTQTALAYAHLYRAAYDIIWRLTADDPTALDEGLRGLGSTLELPLLGLDAAAMRARVLSRLSQSGSRALLIYDNADAIAPRDLRPYLPAGCHLLITSRRDAAQWRGLAQPLTLGVFTAAEAAAFWQRRFDQAGRLDKSQTDTLAELAAELGWLPLALEQAAAFMLAEEMGAAGYLAAFRRERDELWARETPPDAYHATVATTWQMAFAHARRTAGAAELLNLLAFFAPDAIPLDVVWGGAASLPGELAAVAADQWRRRDCLKALRAYSLLTAAGGQAALHRLVQDVTRRGMGEEAARLWVEAALKLLRQAYNFDKYDMKTWVACGQLLPHVQAAVRLAAELGVENTQAAYLNNEAGFYLVQYGDLEGARLFYEQALAIYKKVLGDDHPDTASSLSNMGALLQAMGDLEGARLFYEQTLAIRKKVLGDDHPNTALSLNNMGTLLASMGDLEGALPLYEQALSIHRKVLGDDHPDTASSLNNMGALLQAMGDLEGARPFYEQALAIRKKVLGDDHPDTAQSLNSMGALLRAMGDLVGTRPFYEQALAIRKKVLGDDHPDTASSLNNMGYLLQAMGDLERARPFYEQALAINKKVLGDDHPDTASSLNNMGGLLQAMGDLQGARPFYEQALSIRKKVLGDDHPATARSLNNMGGLLQAMGDLEGARPFYEQALAIRKKVLGDDHPDTAASLNNLAILSYYEGNMQTAMQLMRQALAIWEKALGSAHPQTQSARQTLAVIEAAASS